MNKGYSKFKIIIPIQGEHKVDYFIVNHVDHNSGNSELNEFHSGKRTYDGHMGTDFVLPSFKKMDEGVNVLSAAPGKVIYLVDSIFDREKGGIPSKTYGNMIIIEHEDNFYTYYAHLKKNSALVSLGQNVKSGEVIAKVGSSGYTTDPHLHFEMYYKETLIDPFQGESDDRHSGTFTTHIEYDTTHGTIDSGLINFNASIDTIREHLPSVINFGNDDTAITYWIQNWGMHKGDVAKVEWIAPDASLWFEFSTVLPEDYYYYYWYSWINNPFDFPGSWKAKFYINSVLIDEIDFSVNNTSNINKTHEAAEGVKVEYNQSRQILMIKGYKLIKSLSIIDAQGKVVKSIYQVLQKQMIQLKAGTYLIQYVIDNGSYVEKITVSE